LIAAGIVTGLCSKTLAHKITAVTLVLVCLYIVWISGDFMAGRFYSYLVLVAVFLMAVVFGQPGSLLSMTLARTGVFLAGLCYAIFVPMNPLNSAEIRGIHEHELGRHRVTWERAVYSRFMSLEQYREHGPEDFPYGPPFDNLRAKYALAADMQSASLIAVGAESYFAPADYYIDDDVALTDFLRARLPTRERYWLTGHSARYYPEGYPQALIDGNPDLLTDPYLRQYFTIVMQLTQSDDLWNKDRLITIAKFNMGFYDELLDKADLPRWTKADMFNAACSHSWVLDPRMTRW
jgi:hypothetical protein